MTDEPTSNNGGGGNDDDDNASLIASLVERLRFFFSNANLRQDRWMRDQLSGNSNENGGGTTGGTGGGVCDGGLSLETLLRFNTLKSITTDRTLLARAAMSDDLKDLLIYDSEKEEVRRVTPFDFGTMGDGSNLSLYVKNVPVTKPPSPAPSAENVEEGGGGGVVKEDEEKEEKEGEEKEVASTNDEKFRPRYDVTRDEVKALFETYGRVALVQLRYGKKQKQQSSSGTDEKYMAPNARGGGESYPLGVAIVEFDTMDGIDRACEDLLSKKKGEGEGGGDGDAGAAKVLEMKGNKLVIERMRPSKFFKGQSSGGNKKRSRDDDDADGDDGANDGADEGAKFEPITLDWEKGCVISLSGLDATSCDRESIREAVSDILGVTNDVKTSGLYVDYNRGATFGNLRLKSPKPDEMNELITKLNDGSILIANAKVETAKILDGDDEEKYYENFITWLNNRKRMKDEEKRSSANNHRGNKRQNFGGGRGGGRGRGGRGRGRR